MENTETATVETPKTKSVSVDLTNEQYAFLTEWQKTHEQELGIEVPISAMVRKTVEIAMKSQQKKEERPARSFGDKPAGRSFGDKPRGSFGDKPGFKSGPRKTFGGGMGRGPKFDMTGKGHKTRTFDK